MFPEPFSFAKRIKDMIQDQIARMNIGLSIWEVTDIQSKTEDGYITEYKAQIKHFNFKYTLDNVPITGIGLGNGRGIYKYPNIGDFVIVGFIGEDPFIVGTVPDYFTQTPDSSPLIKLNELIIIPNENGSLILFQDNNDIIIRTADSDGDLDNGCKIKFGTDGGFKVFNKDNYGYECDKNGVVTIRATQINHTQTPGTW